MGFVPVLYGDAVFDSEKGFAILSGDQLVSSLAIELGADRIIMGMDEDGLYTKDPKRDRLVPLFDHLSLEELKSLKHTIEETEETDVTGGMPRKMLELIPAVEHNIQTMIVNATEHLRVYKALKGEKVRGTIFEKGETVE